MEDKTKIAMISVEKAQQAILENTGFLSVENLSVDKASGLVLAEKIFSPMDFPPFDQSGMDGYAFILNDRKNSQPQIA